MFKDALGHEVQISEIIAYATRQGSSTYLNFGIVLDIEEVVTSRLSGDIVRTTLKVLKWKPNNYGGVGSGRIVSIEKNSTVVAANNIGDLITAINQGANVSEALKNLVSVYLDYESKRLGFKK